MKIDLTKITPTKISTDIKGRSFLLYGPPKVGKTSLSAQFPKPIILAFEKGYEALDNAYVVDMTSWSDFKTVCRQLKNKQVRDMYDTVVLDTAQIAYDLAVQFVCSNNGVTALSDVPYGKAYKMVENEFGKSLREITQLGYGIVAIAHEKVKKADKDGNALQVAPDLEKRCLSIINKLVDVVGYITNEYDENEKNTRWVYTRETPAFLAGSRFTYLKPKIKLGYKELAGALEEAILKKKEIDGAELTDKVESREGEHRSFEEIRTNASKLWGALINRDPENYQLIMKKIEDIIGYQVKLSELQPAQIEAFELILQEMETIAESQGINV